MALCAVGAADMMMHQGFGTALTIVLVLALGAFVGAINGLITTRLQIQSFITTLAMLGVCRGVASLWADGYAIPLAFGDGEDLAPQRYKSLFAGELSVFGLDVPATPAPVRLSPGEIAALIASVASVGTYVSATAQSVLDRLIQALQPTQDREPVPAGVRLSRP